jgi:hypothetical protein
MSKSLNIGAALLLITAITGVIVALHNIFMVPFNEKLLGATFTQIRTFNPSVMDTMTPLVASADYTC